MMTSLLFLEPAGRLVVPQRVTAGPLDVPNETKFVVASLRQVVASHTGDHPKGRGSAPRPTTRPSLDVTFGCACQGEPQQAGVGAHA